MYKIIYNALYININNYFILSTLEFLYCIMNMLHRLYKKNTGTGALKLNRFL